MVSTDWAQLLQYTEELIDCTVEVVDLTKTKQNSNAASNQKKHNPISTQDKMLVAYHTYLVPGIEYGRWDRSPRFGLSSFLGVRQVEGASSEQASSLRKIQCWYLYRKPYPSVPKYGHHFHSMLMCKRYLYFGSDCYRTTLQGKQFMATVTRQYGQRQGLARERHGVSDFFFFKRTSESRTPPPRAARRLSAAPSASTRPRSGSS